MALTLDLLKAQEGLSGLTDEQMQSIVGLSERDEEVKFNTKFGEMLGQMDTVIASESAIGRNEGEKTTEYLTRALKALKASADEGAAFKSANETLTAENAKLKDDIAKGTGDAALKADLEKYKGEAVSSKKVNADLQKTIEDMKLEYKGKLESYKMESEIASAMSNMSFRKEYAEAAVNAMKDLARQRVMSAKHVYDETAGTFIFQNEDGSPKKDKSLNNLKVSDMLMAELQTMGILDTGRQQGGAGGRENQGGNNGGGSGNLASAKSKVEADEMIAKQLMAQGHAKSDKDWYELFSQARKDNKAFIDTLPLN